MECLSATKSTVHNVTYIKNKFYQLVNRVNKYSSEKA